MLNELSSSKDSSGLRRRGSRATRRFLGEFQTSLVTKFLLFFRCSILFDRRKKRDHRETREFLLALMEVTSSEALCGSYTPRSPIILRIYLLTAALLVRYRGTVPRMRPRTSSLEVQFVSADNRRTVSLGNANTVYTGGSPGCSRKLFHDLVHLGKCINLFARGS